MPRTRTSTDPISFHEPTGQYYVTRCGSRVYLGADRDAAIERYHRMALGLPPPPSTPRIGHVSKLLRERNRLRHGSILSDRIH